MTAPATMPAIAPPERPLFSTAAAFVCGVDVGAVRDGDVDVVGVGDDSGGVTAGDCVPADGATDGVDDVVAEEGAEED